MYNVHCAVCGKFMLDADIVNMLGEKVWFTCRDCMNIDPADLYEVGKYEIGS